MRRLTAAEYFAQAIALSGKTQKEIAQAAGFDRPNFVSMMKKGQTKIPIKKVPALAKACGVDPQAMLRVIMEEYHPDIWKVLVDTLGEEITLSSEERALVARYRDGESSPTHDTDGCEGR